MTFEQTKCFMLSRLRFQRSAEMGRVAWAGDFTSPSAHEFARRLADGIVQRIEARFVDSLLRERTDDH